MLALQRKKVIHRSFKATNHMAAERNGKVIYLILFFRELLEEMQLKMTVSSF